MEWYDWLNKKNLVSKGDYGVRVARPGYDANYCSDNQLIFNSGWPILQICGVYDFSNKGVEKNRYFYNGEWYDELPSGMTYRYSDSSRYNFCVNKKYIAKMGEVKIYTDANDVECYEYTYKRISHRLGFVPFFTSISNISEDTSGDIAILFYINITNDVDYPYTDNPVPLLTGTRDYGIKSSSIFPRVDGLSTGVFSKLVRAIKTQKSCKRIETEEGITNPIVYWSPLDKDELEGSNGKVLKDYEPFAFSSFDVSGFDSSYNLVYNIVSDEGGDYYREHPVKYAYNSNGVAVGYTTVAQALENVPKISLVVFRSPLVSPNYVEVVNE